MKVKQPLWFWIGVLITLPLAYFVFNCVEFLWSSQKVLSTVENVWGENASCSQGRRRARKPCTKFHARLDYVVNGMTYDIYVSAGQSDGHDQPISQARHSLRERVPVVYDPRTPRRACRDTFWDIWGAALMTFFVQLFAFVGGFSEKKRKN
jgi:hypothetical protein